MRTSFYCDSICCKLSTLIPRQPMVEFHFLTFSHSHAFRYGTRIKETILSRVNSSYSSVLYLRFHKNDSLAIVHYYSHKWREIVSSGRFGDGRHVVFFVFLLSLKPRPFVQSFFDIYMRHDSHRKLPHNCLCPLLFFVFVSVFLGNVTFSIFFGTITVYSLYGEYRYVIRFPLPDGVFLPCNHGLDF